MHIDLLTAFLAGLASFFAPCTFTTLPVFLTFLSLEAGQANKSEAAKLQKKHIILKNVLYYISGFTLVFILLGIGVAGVGRFFIANREIFIKIGGGFLILMGIFILLGNKFKKLSFLYQEKKISLKTDKLGNNFVTPMLLGVTNAFSWSPCIGPILGGILFIASSANDVIQGGLLLCIYALGMTLPLLIFAVFFEKFIPRFKSLKKYSIWIYNAGAVLIILTGIGFLMGWDSPVNALFFKLFSFANSAS